jgi:hypothetical protein
MAVSITLSIRLGPLVSLKITGQNCQELAKALEGHEHLNKHVDALCSDLAERICPEGFDAESLQADEDNEENPEDGEEKA